MKLQKIITQLGDVAERLRDIAFDMNVVPGENPTHGTLYTKADEIDKIRAVLKELVEK